jgi:proline iminopeptidase
MGRAIVRQDVLHHFTRPDGGEGHGFDLMADLSRVACPTLVAGGEDDPMTPIEAQVDIAAALPRDLVRFERFAQCGHGIVADAPEQYIALIREFVAS